MEQMLILGKVPFRWSMFDSGKDFCCGFGGSGGYFGKC